MVTHLSIFHDLGCLTSVIWPFALIALNIGSWVCNIGAFNSGILLSLCGKTKFTAHPSFAQNKHDPKGKEDSDDEWLDY